eukprot:5990836-Pyramimonas_sp.AAC.1
MSDMKRVVRQRRDGAPCSKPTPVSQPACRRARHDYTSTWPTPSMQSALCMLHASGESPERRGAMSCSFGSRGRDYTRWCQHRVVQVLHPWFTMFEIAQGPHRDQ